MSGLDSNSKNIRFSQSTKRPQTLPGTFSLEGASCTLCKAGPYSIAELCQLYLGHREHSSCPSLCCLCSRSRSNLSNICHHPDPGNRLLQVREHRGGSSVKFPTQTAEGCSSPWWKEWGASLLHSLKMSCHPTLPSAPKQLQMFPRKPGSCTCRIPLRCESAAGDSWLK